METLLTLLLFLLRLKRGLKERFLFFGIIHRNRHEPLLTLILGTFVWDGHQDLVVVVVVVLHA